MSIVLKQVKSVFGFACIFQKLDFYIFVFSKTERNPVIMVQAYHFLVSKMNVLGWDYPLHLGVTEAGEGEDEGIKSIIGIGTLLQVSSNDSLPHFCVKMSQFFLYLIMIYAKTCQFSM